MVTPLFSGAEEIDAFQRAIFTRALGRRVHFFDRAGSTNDLASEGARNGEPHGTVYVADAQDAGRGRRGRS